MFSETWKTCSFVSFLVILTAYVYKRHEDKILQDRLNQILTGLLQAEKKFSPGNSRVALGFGGCEDLFAGALDVIEKLNLSAPESPRHFHSVGNAQELAELLGYFFQHGAAAERFVSNKTLFNEILQCAEDASDHRWALGGNAPVMAKRLAMEGLDVLLGARLTKDITEGLPERVKVIGEPLQKSDVHIILEYDKGAKWGQYQAARANRLIVHSDDINPYLAGLEDFADKLIKFRPTLVVVGGLQMMDSFPFKEGERQSRLRKLQSVLKDLPLNTRVHFEMASFTDEQLLKEIMESVVLYSDSLGMNEQELPNLVSLLERGNVTILSDSYPRVSTVLDQMRTVYGHLRKTQEKGERRRLTRLHVHTLAFQAILTTKSASWKNTMSAAAKASLTAHRHTCGSHHIDLMKTKVLLDDSFSASQDKASRKIQVIDDRPVACWEEDDYVICVAPGLVCTQVIQTAGGGDNISAAGLVLQI